jgi:hypothetical protein
MVMDKTSKHRSHISGKRYIRRYRGFAEAQDKRLAKLEKKLQRKEATRDERIAG